MCEFDTEEKIEQLRSLDDRNKEMSYWGWKFEQYVTSGKQTNYKIIVPVVTQKCYK